MPEAWPDWPVVWDNPSAHARDLARYVDVSQTGRFVPEDCFSSWEGTDAGTDRAKRLYNQLLARRIPYSREPWNPVPYGSAEEARYGSGGALQRVRPPNETMQGPATCLDLALVLAGMALSADMRPFIGLQSTPVLHALIVLPVQRGRSRQGAEDVGPPGFTERATEPGVWDLTRPDGLSFGGRTDWLVVDVARAAWIPKSSGDRGGQPFDKAKRDRLASFDQEWTLIDVDRVRRTPLEPYVAPIGRSVPAIYGYLPALRSFIDYPTRQELLRDLDHKVGPELPPGTILLYGEPGRGKSMLAHRIAVAADHGCGWFLNATDDKILTRSLAQAERQEMGNRGEAAPGGGVDTIDDRALASAALRRLRASDEPWVVVLDNCDSQPTPGLRELIPRPRINGQFVVITTTNQDWQQQAVTAGWSPHQLPPLEEKDLAILGLRGGEHGTAYDTPLIAQALAALQERAGAVLPASAGNDGTAVVWHLLRLSECRRPEVGQVARLLAWCPPEPMDPELLGKITGCDRGIEASERLAELSFVSSSRDGDRLMIQLHRLFAAAVRRQTWRDNPAMAADIIYRLITAEAGRRIFIEATDSRALGRLEREDDTGEGGDVPRAAGVFANQAQAGLLWNSLGHIRERRGPVADSGPHFGEALRYLDPDAYPYEVAESMIGQARVVFQNDQSSLDQLAAASERVREARDLLAGLKDLDARQLREQGNALFWLNARKLAGRERNPRNRQRMLTEITEQLWLSYEERLRLARGQDSGVIDRKTPPQPADDLGPERAYYNLAGTYIDLAKVHFELAGAEAYGSEGYRELLARTSDDLAASRTVYQHVRRLREIRYRGQPHPHLAACVQGEAFVAYYRATLLGENGALMESFELTTEAMRQRQEVARGQDELSSPTVLRNGDVRKSAKFMMKVAIAMLFASTPRPAAGVDDVMGGARDAFKEVLGSVRWPSRIGLIGVSDAGN